MRGIRYIRPAPLEGLAAIRRFEYQMNDLQYRESMGKENDIPMSNAPILVMVPSRDRPERISECYESMLETTPLADMIVYVDRDQEDLYLGALSKFDPCVWRVEGDTLREVYLGGGRRRLGVFIGDQIGPVHAVNLIAHHSRGPKRIYGMIPDDALFLTAGWGEYLVAEMEKFPNRVGVVSAPHNGGLYVNFPWVTRAWLDVVGWYYYPHNFHHCTDSILEILGECANAITYAPPEKFSMHHELEHTFNREKFDVDASNFIHWCVYERREIVQRLRGSIGAIHV